MDEFATNAERQTLMRGSLVQNEDSHSTTTRIRRKPVAKQDLIESDKRADIQYTELDPPGLDDPNDISNVDQDKAEVDVRESEG